MLRPALYLKQKRKLPGYRSKTSPTPPPHTPHTHAHTHAHTTTISIFSTYNELLDATVQWCYVYYIYKIQWFSLQLHLQRQCYVRFTTIHSTPTSLIYKYHNFVMLLCKMRNGFGSLLEHDLHTLSVTPQGYNTHWKWFQQNDIVFIV